MSFITVTGFDPSLTNWGCVRAVVKIENDMASIYSIQAVEVISTVADKRKGVRKSTSDITRAKAIVNGLERFWDVDYYFAEAPYGSQSFSAAVSYGLCIGILGALEASGRPIHTLTPQEIKRFCTGDKDADKEAMMGWALTNYPSTLWPTQIRKGEVVPIKGQVEHLADALATIHTGIQTPQFLNHFKTINLLKGS